MEERGFGMVYARAGESSRTFMDESDADLARQMKAVGIAK